MKALDTLESEDEDYADDEEELSWFTQGFVFSIMYLY